MMFREGFGLSRHNIFTKSSSDEEFRLIDDQTRRIL